MTRLNISLLLAGCCLLGAPAFSSASLNDSSIEARHSSSSSSAFVCPTGPTGARGATGATGPAGIQGPTGATGTVLTAASSRYSSSDSIVIANQPIPFESTIAVSDVNFLYTTPGGTDTLTALVSGRYTVSVGVGMEHTDQNTVTFNLTDPVVGVVNSISVPATFLFNATTVVIPGPSSVVLINNTISMFTFDLDILEGQQITLTNDSDFFLRKDSAGRSVILEIHRIGDLP